MAVSDIPTAAFQFELVRLLQTVQETSIDPLKMILSRVCQLKTQSNVACQVRVLQQADSCKFKKKKKKTELRTLNYKAFYGRSEANQQQFVHAPVTPS